MSIKQKMIEAMLMAAYEPAKTVGDRKRLELDAALAVLSDPANWTPGMKDAALSTKDSGDCPVFIAIINHIRGQ